MAEIDPAGRLGVDRAVAVFDGKLGKARRSDILAERPSVGEASKGLLRYMKSSWIVSEATLWRREYALRHCP